MSTARLTLIRFTLRLASAGGVTVPGRNRKDEIDAVLDRDPWGRPQLPGTTLAGALRAECGRVHGQSWADTVFGRLTEPPAATAESQTDHDGNSPDAATVDSVPSRLWVLGTRLVSASGDLASDASVTDRTMTAIDRERAAARTSTLRREELLLPDTRFEVYLQWPGADPTQRTELLAAIAGWQPLIGRGVSRGRGLCAVEDLLWGELDLDKADDLYTWISGGGPELLRSVATRRPPALDVADPALTTLVRVTTRLAGPLLIGSGAHRKQVRDDGETTEVTEPLCEQGEYTVPGSALKGVLRSRIEYILRSAVDEKAACLDQRGECADDSGDRCLPCQLFGFGGGVAGRGAIGQRGRLRVRDAPVGSVVSRDRTHVALNRFTGGAEPGLLFTEHVLEAGQFEVVVDVIDPLTTGQDRAARCLLRLALDDLDDGLIGIGRATTRGYGSLDLEWDGARGVSTTAEARAWLAEYASAYRPSEKVSV